MRLLVTLIVLTCLSVSPELSAEKILYDNFKLLRLTPKNEEALQALRDLAGATFSGFKFWSFPTKVGASADLMVPPTFISEFQEQITKLDMDSQIIMENVQEVIDKEDVKPSTYDGSFGWTEYHTLDEINAWLEALVEEYPDELTLIRAGRTFEGRDIIGVKLSFDPANENRAVFMESNIHAREWITSATNTYILNEFLTSTDERVRAVAEKHDWYFFPVFNPDGFVYSHTTDRMWRKTRVPHRVFCFGSDPNRNWGYLWMNGGADQNPCSDIYAGPEAFSDPSTRTMSEYITSIADKLIAYLDFHSYSQMLLLPYGNTTDHLDNYEEAKEIGDTAMEALAERYGTEYVVGNVAEIIYVATGSSMDWVKGVHRVPIAYCYELRDRGQYGFILPPDQIIPTSEETLDSIVVIMEETEKHYPERYE